MTIGCPKPKRKKTRQRHAQSIMQTEAKRCWLCMVLNEDFGVKRVLHKHHVFGGPRRRKSEAFGLVVYLCPEHHTNSLESAHRSAEIALSIKQACQRIWLKTHTMEEWMEIIGRNYI